MAETGTKAHLQEVAPYFLVQDVIATAEYYRDVLGSSFDRFYGDPLTFTILYRDGVRIMLKQLEGAGSQQPAPRPGGYADAGFWINDADALAAELEARGAEIVLKPVTRSIYEGREMAVHDCDGRVLMFSQLLTAG